MPETEKLTINLTPVDLGRIELLVQQGFYANRAEFIRTAVHQQLDKHAENVRDAVTRQGLVVGALSFGRAELEERRLEGKPLTVKVIGYLSIANDVPPALAAEVIESISVRGVFRAPAEVKEALEGRIH